MQPKLSIIKNFKKPNGNKTLPEIIALIKSDFNKLLVEQIREVVKKGNKDKANEMKKNLPAFTPSGQFKGSRAEENLEEYSKIIHLDFDNISVTDFDTLNEKIKLIPYTRASFISPSGNGIKVFIEVESNMENHQKMVLNANRYYKKELGLDADPKCKDIARLCFFSYDPFAYYNDQSKVFSIEVEEKEETLETINLNNGKAIKIAKIETKQTQLEACLSFTQQKDSYINGNRNNFVHLFASNCNRRGINKDEALSFAKFQFDLDAKEIETCFQSAYSKKEEFAKFAEFASLQMAENDGVKGSSEANAVENQNSSESSPYIPKEVYQNLPEILKQGCDIFDDYRTKDVFLTGALGVISGCLPNVYGFYRGDKVYPHLFMMIIAPPASGKGVLKYARMLAQKHHKEVVEESKRLKQIFLNEQAEYERKIKAKTTNLQKPVSVPQKVVFIPANSSNSRLLEHLQNNGGGGIICETEADVMGNANKQEWGNYSPLLRVAFHHETYSLSRKSGDEYIEITEPRIATILTGTPSQLPNLINSVEDGLFSRFLYYSFQVDPIWQSPSPQNLRVNYQKYFEVLSEKVYDLVKFLEKYPTEIILTPKQWDLLDESFKELLSETVDSGENASSIAFRHGLMLFRLCMILTAMRKFENGDTSSTIICSDKDFQPALSLIKTYFQHSISIYNSLRQKGKKNFDNRKNVLFEELPCNFSRKDAVSFKDKVRLSERSIDYILKEEEGKSIIKVDYGVYQKRNC